MIWATVHSQSCFCWLYRASPFWLQAYNQSDLSIDHLVMFMCRVFSCVVGRGCLLWSVHSLGKTLLPFALLHSVLQGQICLLLQVFLVCALSCLILCDPMGRFLCSRRFQAEIWEWVAISCSRASFQSRGGTCVSCVSWLACGFLPLGAIWWAAGDPKVSPLCEHSDLQELYPPDHANLTTQAQISPSLYSITQPRFTFVWFSPTFPNN